MVAELCIWRFILGIGIGGEFSGLFLGFLIICCINDFFFLIFISTEDAVVWPSVKLGSVSLWYQSATFALQVTTPSLPPLPPSTPLPSGVVPLWHLSSPCRSANSHPLPHNLLLPTSFYQWQLAASMACLRLNLLLLKIMS